MALLANLPSECFIILILINWSFIEKSNNDNLSKTVNLKHLQKTNKKWICQFKWSQTNNDNNQQPRQLVTYAGVWALLRPSLSIVKYIIRSSMILHEWYCWPI